MKTFTLLSSLFCAAVSFADVCTCGVATERNDYYFGGAFAFQELSKGQLKWQY